jgi:hypothetical protein
VQIIYAAPFILLSIVCFAASLVVPSLRRFAVQALIAPIAFGFCSLAAWLISAFILWGLLRLKSNPSYLLPVEGTFFYLLPGLLGAWLAVTIVRLIEQTFFNTSQARRLGLSVVMACIGGPLGFIVGLAVAGSVLPLGSSYWSFIASLASAGFFAIFSFTLCMVFTHKLTTPETGAATDRTKAPLFWLR